MTSDTYRRKPLQVSNHACYTIELLEYKCSESTLVGGQWSLYYTILYYSDILQTPKNKTIDECSGQLFISDLLASYTVEIICS